MARRKKQATQREINRRTRLKAARLIRAMMRGSSKAATTQASSSASSPRTGPALLAPPTRTS